MYPVAILAGGRATRLRPLTDEAPKSLVRVAGRPFIHWQLDLLAREGVVQAVVCIGHLGEQIRAAVGDGAAFGISVRYSSDGDRPLGTGGALRGALALLGDSFFVLYGDSYLPCSFAAIQAAYEQSGAPALMAVYCNQGRWERSNVLFRDGRIVEYDKQAPRPSMAHVDFGLGVLSARVLAGYPAGAAFDLAEVYRDLARGGELAGREMTQRFYEIGSPEGLAATERFFACTGSA